MSKKAAIVAGGRCNSEFVNAYLEQQRFDLTIAADRGLEFFAKAGRKPTIALGDFDSVDPRILENFRMQKGITWIQVPAEKDDTDTELAIKTAIEEGADAIYLFGATGSRLDHMLGSIHAMEIALKAGIPCILIDEYNLLYLADNAFTIQKNAQYGDYVSLIPYTNVVQGLTLKGFKYCLDHVTMEKGNSLGISNEIVEETAQVIFKSGVLIVVQSKDR